MASVDRPLRRLTREDVSLTGDPAVLAGLRLLLIDDDSNRALTLAEDLEDGTTAVAVADGHGEGLAAARELDPDAVILDAAVFANPASRVLERLRRDHRLRWAPLLVVPWEELEAFVEPVALLAGALAELTAYDDELRRRAATEDRFEASLERTGPGRLLRLLAESGAPRRVYIEAPLLSVEVDLAEGLAVSALARTPGEPTLEGLPALARVLELTLGRALVSRLPEAPAANVALPLDEALARAGGTIPLTTSLPPNRFSGLDFDAARGQAIGDPQEPSHSGVVALGQRALSDEVRHDTVTPPMIDAPLGASHPDLTPVASLRLLAAHGARAEVPDGPEPTPDPGDSTPEDFDEVTRRPGESPTPWELAAVGPEATGEPAWPPGASAWLDEASGLRGETPGDPDAGVASDARSEHAEDSDRDTGSLEAGSDPAVTHANEGPRGPAPEVPAGGPVAGAIDWPSRPAVPVDVAPVPVVTATDWPAPPPADVRPLEPTGDAFDDGVTPVGGHRFAAAASTIGPPDRLSPTSRRARPTPTAEEASAPDALAHEALPTPSPGPPDPATASLVGSPARRLPPRAVFAGVAAVAAIALLFAWLPWMRSRRGAGRVVTAAPTSAPERVAAEPTTAPAAALRAPPAEAPSEPDLPPAEEASDVEPPAPAPTEREAAEHEDPVLAARAEIVRGEVALDAGDPETARERFEAALAVDPAANRAMAGLARVASAEGQHRDALAWIDRALEARPRRASYHILRGDVLSRLGEVSEARQAWRKAILLDPTNRTALGRLRPETVRGVEAPAERGSEPSASVVAVAPRPEAAEASPSAAPSPRAAPPGAASPSAASSAAAPDPARTGSTASPAERAPIVSEAGSAGPPDPASPGADSPSAAPPPPAAPKSEGAASSVPEKPPAAGAAPAAPSPDPPAPRAPDVGGGEVPASDGPPAVD